MTSDNDIHLSCDDIRERFDLETGCCPSCHEDVAHGYPLMELLLDDGDRGFVCCELKEAVPSEKTVRYAVWRRMQDGDG